MSSYRPADQERVREALRYIPADMDRNYWARILSGIKSEFGDAGKDMAREWSETAPEKFNRADFDSTWRSVKAGGGVTIGTVFYEAQRHGFHVNGEAGRIDQAEIQKWQAERAERERREAEEVKRAQERASKLAEEIYKAAQPATDEHPYLNRKGISAAPGVRVGRWYQVNDEGERYREKENCLLIPMRDSFGKLWNLQAIFSETDASIERDKDYLAGGRKQGTYFSIGKPEGALAIGEGFATMQSVRAATGLAVCVAFDKGNLLPVAKALRGKFKFSNLILAADNDIREGKPNYGLDKATEAAQAVGALVAVPEMDGRKADFNDLAQAKGNDAVKAAIDNAREPGAQEKPTEAKESRTGADSSAWPSPEPLPALPSVPPFDFNFLPSQLRAFVQDIAERMQCPPEFPAVGAMVMAGSAIGRRLGVRPKLNDSWTVIPNVWGMIVGKSGVMKSPALSDALKPMERMQAKAFKDYEQEKKEFAVREEAAEIRKATRKRKAAEAYSQNAGANLESMLRPDAELVEPKPKRYIAIDTSPEALLENLEDNPKGILVLRDELIGLLRSMDREGNQEARALYLTAADGDKPFTVDRIGRGKGRHIEGLCVSIIGGIQPGVLASYVRETQRGGAGDDGLLQRFALMVYPDVTDEWRNVDRKPDAEAVTAVKELVEHLCTLTAEAAGAEADDYGGIPFLRFDAEAYALFIEWLTDLEKKMRAGEDHPAITSHLSKYKKLVPALALINHLCEGATGAISKEALSRALLFAEFLEAHARRVYSYASRPDVDAAKTVVAKLKAGKISNDKMPAGHFTARDIYKAGWSGLSTPEEAAAALRLLEEYGYIAVIPEQEKTGRPTRVYLAHPSIRGSA